MMWPCHHFGGAYYTQLAPITHHKAPMCHDNIFTFGAGELNESLEIYGICGSHV